MTQEQEREPETMLVVLPQFQHYSGIGLEEALGKLEPNQPFNLKIPLRSCVTTGIEEGTSRKCQCGQYLLIRPRQNQTLSQFEQELEKKFQKDE